MEEIDADSSELFGGVVFAVPLVAPWSQLAGYFHWSTTDAGRQDARCVFDRNSLA